jgi:hypothetical protein
VGTPVVPVASSRLSPLRLPVFDWFVDWELTLTHTIGCSPVSISQRQQFVVPAMTDQPQIVQGGTTVAASCFQDCVVVLLLFRLEVEGAIYSPHSDGSSRARIARQSKPHRPTRPTGPK